MLSTILKQGKDLEIKPKYRQYGRVQLDEQWSYVKEKKKKGWMIYAICAESGELLAASWGKRNKAGVRRLMLKLKGLEIDTFCTGNRESFAAVLPRPASSLQRR